MSAAVPTRPFDPRSARPIHGGVWIAVLGGAPLLATFVGAYHASLVGSAAGLALGLVALIVFVVTQHRLVALHQAAAAALARGDLERGYLLLARIARRPSTHATSGIALLGLAQVGWRLGHRQSALACAARALELLRCTRLPSTPLRYENHARAVRALLLAASGRLDEAEAALPRALDARDSHVAPALAARAAAYLAFRRGHAAEALGHLDAERRSIELTLPGGDRALVQVLESLAAQALGGVYRGAPRSAAPVVVSERERAFVLAYLPEAEPLLHRER